MTSLAAGTRKPEDTALVAFCSYCGGLDPARASTRRVCPSCGLGVMLDGPRGAFDRSGEAFVIVAENLRVSAASAAAEPLLGRPDRVVGQSLAALLGTPDDGPELIGAVARALAGERAVAELEVRVPRTRRSVEVRVARCGSPAGALVVLRRD